MITAEQLRARQGKLWNALRGLVRRVEVSLAAASGVWQALGYDYGDLDAQGKPQRETFNRVEAFTGIGFFSRPKATSTPEAILIHVGTASGHPIMIAFRDKATQPTDLEADETATYNSVSIVRHKANGEVHVTDRAGGVAGQLATKADLNTLKAAINGAAVVAGDGGAAFKANLMAALAAFPVGTQKLRGQ